MDEAYCFQDGFGQLCLEVGGVDVVLTHAEGLEQGGEFL